MKYCYKDENGILKHTNIKPKLGWKKTWRKLKKK